MAAWEHDRPPVAGVVGRESGELRLEVCHQSDRETLEAFVVQHTSAQASVYTDEWMPATHLDETGTGARKRAPPAQPTRVGRDDDGDGVREVHCNTLEGIWTGVRNFLRPFRGVHKANLDAYINVFEIGYRFKTVTSAVSEP